MTRLLLLLFIVVLTLSSCTSPTAVPQSTSQSTPVSTHSPSTEPEGEQIAGQTIYVPVYSHIYMRDKTRVINLTATLSIRNTDGQNAIRISAVRYYGTDGTLVREYVKEPSRLAPMASLDFVVDEDDTTGGVGANFIVEWSAGVEVTPPVVEAVMISAASQQGISFVSEGRVIKERSRK